MISGRQQKNKTDLKQGDRKRKKKQQKFGAEEYSDWTEDFSRELQ